MTHRVIEMPAMRFVGLRGHFTPQTVSEIPALWMKFVPRLGRIPGQRGWTTYGAVRGVSDGRGGRLMEYTAAVEVEGPGRMPSDLVAFDVSAGAYAAFTHRGHIREIGKTWSLIWDRWMKEAGFHHLETYDFEVYDQRWNPQTGEGDVDILVPIRRPIVSRRLTE